jgi:hypothetical protein
LRPWVDWKPLPLTVKEDLIAYSQIRDYEEVKHQNDFLAQLVKAKR